MAIICIVPHLEDVLRHLDAVLQAISTRTATEDQRQWFSNLATTAPGLIAGIIQNLSMLPCREWRCFMCPHVHNEWVLTLSNGDSVLLDPRSRFNCSISRCIYVLWCTRCDEHYVGQTGETLRSRYRRHLMAIRRRDRSSRVGRHFRRCGCLPRVLVVEWCPHQTYLQRLARERWWIRTTGAVINQ